MMDARVVERFWSKVEKTSDCWCWKAKSVDANGYGIFKIGKRSFRAHRLAWELANGHTPGTLLVCHTCDTPWCVNPGHLFLGTPRDNYYDCLAKGRYSPKGTGNAASKLDDIGIRKIRRLYASGTWSQRAIARKFNVNQTTISAIVRGAKWRHVDAA